MRTMPMASAVNETIDPAMPYIPTFMGVTSAMIVLDVAGAVGNVILFALCLGDYRTPGTSEVTLFIMQAAAAWFVQSALVLAPYDAIVLLSFRGVRIPVDETMCSVLFTATAFLYVLGSWTETFLAINRVFAICAPNIYNRISSRTVVIAMMLMAWLLSSAELWLIVFKLAGEVHMIRDNRCTIVPKSFNDAVAHIVTLYTPGILTGACCSLIMLKVIASKWRGRPATGVAAAGEAAVRRTHARRMQVTVMLLGSYAFVTVTALPYALVTYILPRYTGPNPFVRRYVEYIFEIGWMVNPYNCILLNRGYMTTLKAHLRRLCFGNTVSALQLQPANRARRMTGQETWASSGSRNA
ncbi:hypothetical protein BV898_17464 [Hypsibius exemplaris]|uniref:G-protein coupled receptors family 1 profile domain-containing protein n=1 Tax=Hypsibius exemplaris TaxID=2072580 RepID=A0A9X6RM22_HYPEX|nr:hypothetical protein BV898_17464 [Hypsibius exemplaris]